MDSPEVRRRKQELKILNRHYARATAVYMELHLQHGRRPQDDPRYEAVRSALDILPTKIMQYQDRLADLAHKEREAQRTMRRAR